MSNHPKKTILLVDDEAIIALKEARILKDYGYEVITSFTGEGAVSIVSANPEIDLVLMDINLGRGIDGTQAAKLILQQRDLPLIFLSSHTEREVVEKTEGISSYGYIVKHSDEAVLIASIKMAFRLFESRLSEKDTEAALRQSEERYHSLFRLLAENVSDVIWILDLEAGKFRYVSPAVERMRGYRAAEVLAQDLVAALTPASYQFIQAVTPDRLKAFHAGSRSYYVDELEQPCKDGSTVWTEATTSFRLNEDNGRLEVYGVSRNIHERKCNEALVRLRLDLLEFAATHTLDEFLQKALDEICALVESEIGFYHFVEADQRTLSLQAWSTRTLKEFCQAEGKGLHYPLDLAGVWVECVKLGKPVIHNHYAALAHRKGLPEGHAEVVRELVVPVFREGRIVAILGVGNKARDYSEKDAETVAYLADVAWEITRRKITEAELQHLLLEKEHLLAEKEHLLAEKGILMRELQHRTKNSLNVVNSLLTIEMENLPDGRSRAIFANAGARIRSMAAIYEQLYQDGSIDRVNLGTYFQRLAAALSTSYLPIGGLVELVVEAEEIDLDLKRALPLGIIVNELVTNAIKYAFPPGAAGEIRILLKRDGKKILLQVCDNGVGMQTGVRPGNGSGLGLTLVEMLTAQVGGEVRFGEGSGTTVQVVFAE